MRCGIFLAQQQDNCLGFHLGLQLVEYFVRYCFGECIMHVQVIDESS